MQLGLGNNPSGTVQRSVTFGDLGRGREGGIDGAQGNLCAVKLLCDTMVVDTCYTFVQIHRMYNTKGEP